MSLDPLIVTIDTLTLNLANAEQERDDLKAKLEKVEADAAVMRGAITEMMIASSPEEQSQAMQSARKALKSDSGAGLFNELSSLREAMKDYMWNFGPNRGKAVLDELATLRATAQSRQDLLKRCEWKVRKSASTIGYCSFCDGIEPDHKPTCSLAAELKEAHD